MPAVFLNSYKNWEKTDVRVGKDVVKRSLHFPRLTVEEMQALTKMTPDAITKLGKWGTPTYLLLDGAQARIGDRLDRGTVTHQKMLEDLAAAQKKLGAAAPMGVYRDFAKALDGLADDFVKTVRALDKVKGQTDAMRKAAESKIDERIAAAEPEALGKWADALKGHSVEKKIRERMK